MASARRRPKRIGVEYGKATEKECETSGSSRAHGPPGDQEPPFLLSCPIVEAQGGNIEDDHGEDCISVGDCKVDGFKGSASRVLSTLAGET